MEKIFILFLLILSMTGFSQTNSSSIVKFHSPNSVSSAKGYSHSVEIDLGTCKMIILSGQVALDKQGNLIGRNNLAQQTKQVLTNIQNIISESGGTMDDVIKIGIYMIDISQVSTMREVRDEFFNSQRPPASTF